MEESANKKIQETPKVETEEEDKKVVVNTVDEEDLKHEVSSSKDIGLIENYESAKENLSGNETNLEEEIEEGKDAQLGDLEVTGDGENKTEPIAETDERSVPLVDESASIVEVSVEKSKDSELTEVEVQEIEEKISSLNEINGIAPNVNVVVLNGADETPSIPLPLDETDRGASQVVPHETDEIKPPPSEEKNDLSSVTDLVSKGIEEKILPSVEENIEASSSLTDAVSKETDEKTLPSLDENVVASSLSAEVRSKGIEEAKVLPSTEKSEEPSTENVEDSSNPVTSSPAIGSSDGFPESVGNTPIISLRQRNVQRTSWRSCCGLFEVLRRSDR